MNIGQAITIAFSVMTMIAMIGWFGFIKKLYDRVELLEKFALKQTELNELFDKGLSRHEQNLKSLPEVITAEVTSIFSDPDRIDRELERSAELTELRRANRKHKVRDDAGPPAKSHRLNINRR